MRRIAVISGLGLVALAAALVLTAPGCALWQKKTVPGAPLKRTGDEIMVCGKLFHTGAPVVLWTDPGGYDAYRLECRFTPERISPRDPVSDGPARYGPKRRLPPPLAERVQRDGWTLDLLRQRVDLFVLHYDVAGTSRRCFEILHDIRGLSVHFLLDLDGTIYQTLDLKERAWHAGSANDRSVGIEIANIGAYEDMAVLEKWYDTDAAGTLVTLPDYLGDGGLRNANYVPRPARPEPVQGVIHGRALYQYDLTDAQYDSLIKLTATLCRVLPNIRPAAPRDRLGNVRSNVLKPEELGSSGGVVGHWHLTRRKVDPGPAFDWDRLMRGVRPYMD